MCFDGAFVFRSPVAIGYTRRGDLSKLLAECRLAQTFGQIDLDPSFVQIYAGDDVLDNRDEDLALAGARDDENLVGPCLDDLYDLAQVFAVHGPHRKAQELMLVVFVFFDGDRFCQGDLHHVPAQAFCSRPVLVAFEFEQSPPFVQTNALQDPRHRLLPLEADEYAFEASKTLGVLGQDLDFDFPAYAVDADDAANCQVTGLRRASS